MEERLLNEILDLTRKITRLECFLQTEKFKALGTESKDLLLKQIEIMNQYRDILFTRIQLIMAGETTVDGTLKELR